MRRSDAIRHALVSTARRTAEREALRREVADVAADEDDQREMALITEIMDEISEPW
jgi:hypothetical protein